MKNRTVDLDDLESWPDEIRSAVDSRIHNIIAERNARIEYDRSGERWFSPAPASPCSDTIYRVIADTMQNRDLRVFHATRLVDFDVIRTEGLRPLDLKERILRLDGLTHGPLKKFKGEIDDIVARVDLTDSFFTIREGSVWATPMRRFLHDGGCDVFFDHWGGEAVQRMASMASPDLESAIQCVGRPAVVVFRIPAFGFCEYSDLRLAPTMLELALEGTKGLDLCVGGWDVHCKQDVPPEWIEDVLSPDDPTLSA